MNRCDYFIFGEILLHAQVLSWLRSTLNTAGVQEKAIDLYTKKFQLHGKLLNRSIPMLI